MRYAHDYILTVNVDYVTKMEHKMKFFVKD